jgi:hypothetical protein
MMAGINEAELRTLLDRAQIHDALMRYCRGVDRGDGELVMSALHPDATLDLGRGPAEAGTSTGGSAATGSGGAPAVCWSTSGAGSMNCPRR